MFYKGLKKDIVLIVLFSMFILLVSIKSYGQEENMSVIDSIITLDISKEDRTVYLTRESSKRRYSPESRVFIEAALKFASNPTKDASSLANAYYNLGNFYFYNAKPDSALVALDIADKYVDISEDDMTRASILNSRGGVYSYSGDVVRAITLQLQAMSIYDNMDTLSLEVVKRKQRLGKSFVTINSLANLYLKIEDFDKALTYYNMGYYMGVKKINNLPNTAVLLSNKGELLFKMGRYKEALRVSLEARDLKKKAKLPARFVGMSNLNIGKVYAAIDSTELALKQFNSSLNVSQEENNKRLQMLSLTQRGLLYLKLSEFKKAQKDCAQAKEMAFAINDNEVIINSCDCLYQAERLLGNYEESLLNYELYSKAKDSLYNDKNVRKVTQLGLQYEFDKKEEQKLLEIDKKRRQRNLAYTGIGILSVFALLIVFFFRKRLQLHRTIARQENSIKNQEIIKLKQKSKITSLDSMIEGQEKERARIAQDLHDSLGGLLSSVKSHFQSTRKEDEQTETRVKKTTSLIDEAASEVRRISHNMMPYALTLSGLEEAISDIAQRLRMENYEVILECGNLPQLTSNKEITIYRLLQELVNNIRKHAKAKTIYIQLYAIDKQGYITIEDDGEGFDVDSFSKEKNKGLGLQSVQSRVDYLDGEIVWDSEIGKGTTVNINFVGDEHMLPELVI